MIDFGRKVGKNVPKEIYSRRNYQHLRTIEIEKSKGLTHEEMVKGVGISLASAACWKKEYGGLRVDQARKLKDLELENQRTPKQTLRG